MILFAVYPEQVTSRNDWDRHHIGARQLMELYRVRPAECAVFRDEQDAARWDERRLTLMPLTIRANGYTPVTDAERERIRRGERWWSASDHPWAYRLTLDPSAP